MKRIYLFNMACKEIWKDIETHMGFYQVSNLGMVRSLDRTVTNKRYGKQRIKGCYLSCCINSAGYNHVALRDSGVVKVMTVHRLVANAFLSNPMGKETVNHINGDKNDNRIANLEWNTWKENVNHAWANGLVKQKTGEQNGRSILTWKNVRAIRKYISLGGKITHKQIAKKYGVSRVSISKIIRNETWVIG